MKRLLAATAICLLLYAATGLCFVEPDELVVVRRFGRVIEPPRGPGAHFGLPWGLDQIDRIKPREIKRVMIGSIPVGRDTVSNQFLTGDRNLVNIRATVQYAIQDPVQYLFQFSAEETPLVSRLAQSTMADVLCGQPVDRVLTRGKQELGLRIRTRLQEAVEDYGLGLAIRSVDIGVGEPPAEVADAFNEVISALHEKQQNIHDAGSYARRIAASSAAESQRIRNESYAYRLSKVRRAEGEAESFERLLAEYIRRPDLTARRLYLETMAVTLPRFRSKLVVATEAGVDLSIVGERESDQ